MSWKPLLVRHHPWILLALMLGIAGYRFPFRKPEVRCHNLMLPDPRDFRWEKERLFGELLPRAAALKAGVADPEEFRGFDRVDPRRPLLILWDDLSPTERAAALQVLGYPPEAGPRQILRGPHPAWFVRAASLW